MKARFSLISALALLVTSGILYAGPLNPPPGPVTSTYKTLTEVEPRIAIDATNTPGDADSLFKITLPGSYYLTGNITGVVGKHGIEIVASGVTLDLNGFTLAGVFGMGAFDGVTVTEEALTNIAVVNGSVRNWGGEGVDLGSLVTLETINGRVERVRASSNLGKGILTGLGYTISNCSAYNNTGTGISGGEGSTITDCTAFQNIGTGISGGAGSTVSNCSASQNTMTGFDLGTGGTATNCSAFDNNGSGFVVGTTVMLTECSASNNSGNGIIANSGCTVIDCTANLNVGRAITVTNGSTVAGCTVYANTVDGIHCWSNCVIRDNNVAASGNGGNGANIYVFGNDTRVEGNTCTQADRGIQVAGCCNIIIKNTCSSNTNNWDIAAGNSVGPIVTAGTNAAAIVGNGASPSTLGSTDPNANFNY